MATHYKITAPDPTYSGLVGRAAFHQGVARIDAEGMDAELRYFTRRGYTVELVEETPIKEQTPSRGRGGTSKTGG